MTAAPEPAPLVADDPETIQFLAAALATFMRVAHGPQGRWTRRRVAADISAREAALSDTTLGRFLDPDDPQVPSPGTVRAVATWLLHRRWIDARDLALLGAAAHLRQMNELAGFFGVGDGAAQDRFRAAVAGPYAGVAVSGRFLLLHRLLLRRVEAVPGLIARETLRLFDIGNADGRRIPDEPALPDLFRLPSLIRTLGGRELTGLRNGGILAAGPGIATALLRGEVGGFNAVLTLDAILFDGERIAALQGTRATGWQALERGGFLTPPRIAAGTPPHRLVQLLSARLDVEKYEQLRRRTATVDFDREGDNSEEESEHHFFNDQYMNKEENEKFIEESLRAGYEAVLRADMTPEDKLLLAWDWKLLDRFRALLRDGADPNVRRPGQPLPIVFEMASVAEPEWIDALLESERLDLTLRDHRRMLPSFYAGVAARDAVAFGDEEEAGRYGTIHRKLRAAEERQGALPWPGPSPA